MERRLQIKPWFVWLVLSSVFLTACGHREQVLDTNRTPWPVPLGSEDELLEKYSTYMTSNPVDTASIQQNELIEVMIAKGWNLERHKSGVFYTMVEKGNGPSPVWGDHVDVHYNGYFTNGKRFDSSYQRDIPLKIYMGNMIDGWNAVMPLLGVGGKGIFLIPSHLAYGTEGFGRWVGPNEHLLFEIELLELAQ